MLLDINYFGDVSESYSDALDNAFASFTRWRKSHKISSSQRPFSIKALKRAGYGWYLNAKGFNSRCIVEWLLACVVDVNQSMQYRDADERAILCEACLILTSIFRWMGWEGVVKVFTTVAIFGQNTGGCCGGRKWVKIDLQAFQHILAQNRVEQCSDRNAAYSLANKKQWCRMMAFLPQR